MHTADKEKQVPVKELEEKDTGDFRQEEADKSAEKKEGRLTRIIDWIAAACKIVLESKLVIIGCMLVQGFFFTFNPKGSLEWDVVMLTGLTGLYALASLIVEISNGNKIAQKGKDIADGLYKGYWDSKQNQMAGSDKNLSENKVVKKRDVNEQERAEKFKDITDQKKDAPVKRRWLIIIAYALLFIACVWLSVFKSFADYSLHLILGIVILLESISSLVKTLRSKDGKTRDRVVAIIIAIFSIILGLLLLCSPVHTSMAVMQIFGIGFLIKALMDIIAGLINRSLIDDTKDRINQLKTI